MVNKAEREGRSNERVNLGRRKEEALFPAAPPLSDLPEDYAEILIKIKSRIQQERLRVVMAANSAMILLYWDIGKMILERQEHASWGAKIIDRLAKDLQETFPGMKGFSPRNLKYMRAFSVAWPQREIVQEILAQITWYHNIALLEKLTGSEERLWYANEIIKNGWSRNVLSLQIESRLRERQGKAITNFRENLPLVESDIATQVFKDPYLFDFLGTADLRRECEVEQALIDHIQHFLLELGAGFAFVGRQVPLEVASHDFRIDLLFYHLKLRCFVVIELKAVPFDPSFVGQLNFYLSVVDDLLRHPDDKPTIGLLLCRTKDKLVVEYALRDLNKPIGVAEWETRIVKELPKELESSLPTIEELEKEINEYEKGENE
jgi:predicted nuclease of restriction endonuclease-like (RecB) superfamily